MPKGQPNYMIHCSAFTRIGESNMTQIKKVGGSDRRTETEIIPYDGGASRRAFDLNHGRWLHWDVVAGDADGRSSSCLAIHSFVLVPNESQPPRDPSYCIDPVNNCMFLQGGPLLNSGERQKDQSQIEGRPKNYSHRERKSQSEIRRR